MSRILSALPHAGVVKCKKCGGTVACRAVDPPSEHSQPETAKPPPGYPVIVSCSCCGTALRYSPSEIFQGQPLPSATCVEHQNKEAPGAEEKKPNAAILIAASLIAAVRLNREEIRSLPAVHSKIADSIRLAEMIPARPRN